MKISHLSQYKFHKQSVSLTHNKSIKTKIEGFSILIHKFETASLEQSSIRIGRWIAGTNHHALATRRRSEEFQSSDVTGSRLILRRRRLYQFRCSSNALYLRLYQSPSNFISIPNYSLRCSVLLVLKPTQQCSVLEPPSNFIGYYVLIELDQLF